jgi:hypothetical protein
MGIVLLGDLQRAFRTRQRADRRHQLRDYLLGHGAPSAPIYRLVSRRLYADGLIDNLGLTDSWIAGATEAQRADLYSAIATALVVR